MIEGKHCFSSLDIFIVDSRGLKDIIWKGVKHAEVFPTLRELHIINCQLDHVTWLLNLPSLELFRLGECKNMELLAFWEQAAEREESFRRLKRAPFPDSEFWN